MKHLFLVITLLMLSGLVLAEQDQISKPSAYTPTIGLRLYESEATPGADSLNQNSIDIDNAIKDVNSRVFTLQIALGLMSLVVIVLGYKAIRDKS